MKLLLSILVIGVLLLVFEKQIKKYNAICYIICILIAILNVFLPQNFYPSWLSKFLTNYFQRGTIATALFIIVMYAILMPKKSRLIRVFMGLRGEIAIMASLLILIHNVSYGKFYFKILFTDIDRLQNIQILAAIASIVMIALLIPLTITSFKFIRKRIPAKKWKRLQRWSYLFYGLLYVHVALIFSPQILRGNMLYMVDMCIYTVTFGAYVTLRIKKYVQKQIDSNTQKVMIAKAVNPVGAVVVSAFCITIIILSVNNYKIQEADAEEIKVSQKTFSNKDNLNEEVENDWASDIGISDETDTSEDTELSNITSDSDRDEILEVLYADGIWTGEGQGYYDKVKVEVTISDGKIIDIEILENEDDYEYFSMAEEEIPKAIIDKQSVNVDTVSGATYSSKGIKKAVQDALDKATE